MEKPIIMDEETCLKCMKNLKKILEDQEKTSNNMFKVHPESYIII